MTRPQERWEPTAAIPAAVYIAINEVTGHLYVGYTMRPLRRRIYAHVNASVCGSRTRFANAIRKYGRNSFDFIIVAECATKDEALYIECRMIKALKPQYNLTEGGDGAYGLKHSDEAKVKMKAWRVAHPDHKPRQGKTAPGSGLLGYQTKLANGTVTKPMLGVRMSEETKEKIRATKSLNPRRATLAERSAMALRCKASNPCVRKAVVCLNDGKAYPSAAAAAVAYGFNRRSVACVANPSRPQSSIFGHRFEYLGAE